MKQRIYLDTSVISFLKAEDSPEKMHDTVLLWDDINCTMLAALAARNFLAKNGMDLIRCRYGL